MQTAFGDMAVRLDDESDPPTVVINGDGDLVKNLKRVLYAPNQAESAGLPTCAICMDETDDIVRIAECEHTVCNDCLGQYCTILRDAKYPLRCFQRDCNVLISSRQLKNTLSNNNFKVAAQQAVHEYFDRHLNTYVKCPGADCSMYLPTNRAENREICPSCLMGFCTKCQVEFHFGESCADFQDRIAGHLQALEATLQQIGAKRCKSCNTPVEKIEGCDNFQCVACKAHFCWACMEIFPTHDDVYKHLMRKHGGYIADPAERERAEEEWEAEQEIAADLRGLGLGMAGQDALREQLHARRRAWQLAGLQEEGLPPPPPADGRPGQQIRLRLNHFNLQARPNFNLRLPGPDNGGQ